MPPVGSVDVDLTTTPSGQAQVAVTGQTTIAAGSHVEAWVEAPLAGTADHTMDEHIVENLQVRAGNILPGTGFTIYAEVKVGVAHGLFQIGWAWGG